MGVQLSSDEMTKLFDEFDTTANNTIKFSEFKGMVDECLAGNDVNSESSRSTTSGSSSTMSGSSSFFSSDSMALQKHPLILQVPLYPFPACDSILLFHSAGPGAVPPACLAFVMHICTLDCNHSKHGIHALGASQGRQNQWEATSGGFFPVLGADVWRFVAIDIDRPPQCNAIVE
jgi:hypothetical protein